MLAARFIVVRQNENVALRKIFVERGVPVVSAAAVARRQKTARRQPVGVFLAFRNKNRLVIISVKIGQPIGQPFNVFDAPNDFAILVGATLAK